MIALTSEQYQLPLISCMVPVPDPAAQACVSAAVKKVVDVTAIKMGNDGERISLSDGQSAVLVSEHRCFNRSNERVTTMVGDRARFGG